MEAIRSRRDLSDAAERCRDYLRKNGVDLAAPTREAALGRWLSFDPDKERFVGEFADRANGLSRRDYREPFVVPDV